MTHEASAVRVSEHTVDATIASLSWMRPSDGTRTIGPEVAANIINALYDLRDSRARIAALTEALRECERAMNAQVQLVHAREAHFRDAKAMSRPMDWQPLCAELYMLTAEPLVAARTALESA